MPRPSRQRDGPAARNTSSSMNDARDDSEDFSLERHHHAPNRSNRDKGVDESTAKSAPIDKTSAGAIQDSAFPDRIRRKYYVVANESGKDGPDGEARLYADERGEYLAFKVTEDRLVTRLAAAEGI